MMVQPVVMETQGRPDYPGRLGQQGFLGWLVRLGLADPQAPLGATVWEEPALLDKVALLG